MIEITSKEAKHLESIGYHCPKTCRLKNKGASRGKHYCVEERKVLEELKKFRDQMIISYSYGNV